MMIAFVLPIEVGTTTGAPDEVTIGALTFFAAATMASMSRTMIFIMGAPGSPISGCLCSWRSVLNSVSSKLKAPFSCVMATRRVTPGVFVRICGPVLANGRTSPFRPKTV